MQFEREERKDTHDPNASLSSSSRVFCSHAEKLAGQATARCLSLHSRAITDTWRFLGAGVLFPCTSAASPFPAVAHMQESNINESGTRRVHDFRYDHAHGDLFENRGNIVMSHVV